MAARPAHDKDRAEQDRKVQQEGLLSDIDEVEPKLVSRIGMVAAAHLRQSCNAGPDVVAPGIGGNERLVPPHKVRSLRTRPHEAHLSAEHIPELRNLVDAKSAKPSTDRGKPRVTMPAGQHRARACLSILDHRPELIEHEGPAETSYTLLGKDHGTPRRRLDQQ